MSPRIDLRSDTVTQPTPAMRRAIFEAELGDDVYGEDPTVKRLEQRVATLLGKQAGLYFPSGTMANQAALRAHTEPGDEVIIEAYGHSYFYETGGMAALSGVQARPIPTAQGLMDPTDVARAINAENSHFARSRVVVIENTANRGGGTIYELPRIEAIADVAEARGLVLHIDGARLWNAHVATGVPLDQLVARAASVSVCLSKGLGAPVGSVLVGSLPFIARAHRFRKQFGGGMRQAGLLAAAGLHAVDHHIARLAEDHANLAALAHGLAETPGLVCDPARYPTNIAFATVTQPGLTAPELSQRLAAEGVLANASSGTELRFVTHLDVDRAAITDALARIARVLRAA